MAEKAAAAAPVRASNNVVSRWLAYAFVGGAAGLVIGVASLFVASVLYGEALGLSPLACTAVACVLTLLLSQPAGLAGMVSGAAVGAVAGVVVHYVQHRGVLRTSPPGA